MRPLGGYGRLGPWRALVAAAGPLDTSELACGAGVYWSAAAGVSGAHPGEARETDRSASERKLRTMAI